MNLKNLLKTILIVGTIGILLSGCSNSSTIDETKEITIESDEVTTNSDLEEEFEKSIEEEFIPQDDNIEIGELI